MSSSLRLLLKYLIHNFGGHKIAINESGDTTWWCGVTYWDKVDLNVEGPCPGNIGFVFGGSYCLEVDNKKFGF